MDILVTTPKTAHELAAQEAEFVAKHPDAYWFRTIKGKPNIRVGERVYYVDNGQITGYGVIFDIEHGEMECEATGKVYEGTHLKQRKWFPLKKPVPFSGFQGFRYIDKISGLRVKLEATEKEIEVRK